ncbi:MAG: hypothetical protein OXI40_13380 [Chloroflexota bacterium]|nr:hypothetical protein [Chloroflexota bacterium]
MENEGVHQYRHRHATRLRTILLMQFRRDILNRDRVCFGERIEMLRGLIDAQFKEIRSLVNELGRDGRGLSQYG